MPGPLDLAVSTPVSRYAPVVTRLVRMLYEVMHGIVPPLMRAVWRPTVIGREHVPDTGGVILASNHLSFVDSIAIPSVVKRKVVFLTKSDYFTGSGPKGLVSRAFFEGLGMLPVDRDDSKAAIASLATALEVLGRGEAFGIYPEGTRSRDGRLYRAHRRRPPRADRRRARRPRRHHRHRERMAVDSNRLRVVPVTIEFGKPLDFTGQFDGVPLGRARRRRPTR